MELRRIEPGPDRLPLVPLLLLADEAEDHVRRDLDEGDLFAFSLDGTDVGAVQVVTSDPITVELRLVAVAETLQGQGVGRSMVAGVLEALTKQGWRRVIVGTSNAGVGQIAFYQKCGFRLLRIERDYFDEARGYDGTSTENGIVHRDLVWLDQMLSGEVSRPPPGRHDWHADSMRAAGELGPPIFGLTGPLARAGVLNGHGGRPCDQVTLLYRPTGMRIEVTTSTRPLLGIQPQATMVLSRAQMDEPTFPFTITLSERTVMIPISGTPTAFRAVESSTGHWQAAGDFAERHLSISGTPGVVPEDLALAAVALDFSV